MPAVCPCVPLHLRRKGQKASLEGGLEEKVKGKLNKKHIRAKWESVKIVIEISMCKPNGKRGTKGNGKIQQNLLITITNVLPV